MKEPIIIIKYNCYFMKKALLIIVFFAFTAAVLSSCASTRGKGCPTTNPRYFKG
jgi:ABC-type transport system involved in Fe-S cluster assembly fused permease/ATPase subunit